MSDFDERKALEFYADESNYQMEQHQLPDGLEGELEFSSPAQDDGGERARAALAAREEPHVKGAILQIGTVVEGRPEGWVFDGAHIGHLILPDGSQVCGGWTVSELELIGAAREDTERPDDYWNLCCECGYITIADSWLALNFNEAHEDETTPYEPRLIPAESDPSVYRCPACGHDHEDNDSGAGVFDGTRENVIAERTRLIDDGWEFDPVVRNTEQEHDEA